MPRMLHIHPLDVLGLYKDANGEVYVRTKDGFFRRSGKSETEFVMAEGQRYAAPVFEPVDCLPAGCSVISGGPIAAPIEDEIEGDA